MTAGSDPQGIPFIAATDRIALGIVSSEILPLLERWYNDLEVSRTLGVNWHPLTSTAKQRFLGDVLTSATPTFTVYERESASPIGITGFDHLDYDNGTAEFSIVIGERSARGKGLGTETARLVLNYAFDVLGLHNVWLQVASNNAGAIRAYEKAGFKHIGVRRRSIRVGRELIDDVYMDAVADDFGPSALAAIMHPPEETR